MSAFDPLHQLEGDALRALEEPQLSADVIHLVAQHGYAIGHEVRGGRLDVVDAEREVVEAPLPQIRRVQARIVSWSRIELEQLDLETRIRPLEHEGDVLRCAFMPGMPMYRAGGPPSIVTTWSLRKPRSAKKSIAGPASATAMVT